MSSSEKTLEELVIEYQQSACEETFEEIIGQLRPLIYGQRLQKVFCYDDRPDYIQEFVLCIFEAIKNFDLAKGQSFVAFAGQVLRNRHMNLYRYQTSSKRYSGSRDLSYDQLCESFESVGYYRVYCGLNQLAASPEEACIHRQDMLDFLRSLSEWERVFFNYYQQGLPNEEIARRTGRTLRQVQAAHDRCRKKLKQFSKELPPSF